MRTLEFFMAKGSVLNEIETGAKYEKIPLPILRNADCVSLKMPTESRPGNKHKGNGRKNIQPEVFGNDVIRGGGRVKGRDRVELTKGNKKLSQRYHNSSIIYEPLPKFGPKRPPQEAASENNNRNT